jgi:Holliday junction resolvasome RuvABC DNA-binding subunit
VSALIHLGYSDARAAEAVACAASALGEHTEAGVLIREALKGIARS